MSWLIFAILTAVFLSIASLIEKKALVHVHAIDFSAAVSIWSLVFSVPFLFFIDFSLVTGKILVFVGASAFMAATAFVLVAKGIRHLDISLVSPILSLSPGTTAVLGFIVLGEKLSALQVAGVGAMIVGSYILAVPTGRTLRDSLKSFSKSYHVHLVLLSLLFYSIGAVLDRTIVDDLSLSVPAFMFLFHIFITIFSLFIASLFGGGMHGVGLGLKKGGSQAVLVSLLTVGYRFFQMEALQLAFVGLVSAVKRSSSFFTTLIGGGLFNEKNLARRVFASIVIIVGVFLIAF